MAWRAVHVSQASRLSVKDNQLVVAQNDGEVRLALEDIACLILDTPQVSLTTSLMSAAMDAGIAILSTDARHMPNGLMLPFHTHHRQAGIAAQQIAASLPLKKRCWQRIVVAKIENQAAHLSCLGRGAAEPIAAMAGLVGSGDPDNIEARAARAYWPSLFDSFIRDNPSDLRNKMLNYGYGVLRAAIARSIVGCGLLPAFGLNHASITNSFNLADDLIEPFRPFVDALVTDLAADRDTIGGDMTVDDRRALAAILMQTVKIERETVSVLVAVDKAAVSLVRAIEANSSALLALPEFASRALRSSGGEQ
jgi:CRISPR-associated protein Cas1